MVWPPMLYLRHLPSDCSSAGQMQEKFKNFKPSVCAPVFYPGSGTDRKGVFAGEAVPVCRDRSRPPPLAFPRLLSPSPRLLSPSQVLVFRDQTTTSSTSFEYACTMVDELQAYSPRFVTPKQFSVWQRAKRGHWSDKVGRPRLLTPSLILRLCRPSSLAFAHLRSPSLTFARFR